MGDDEMDGRRINRAKALRRAQVGPGERPAIERFIDEGWLRDRTFTSACVVQVDEQPAVAVIDWPAVAKHAYWLEVVRPARALDLWSIYDSTGKRRPSATDTEP